MIDKETFGLRLKSRRVSCGLTQAELADRAHIPNWNRISNWELGYNYPPLNALCGLAVALDCSVDFLMGLDEQILDADELKQLESYRQLDESGKELIRTVMDSQLRRIRSDG